MAVLLTGLRLCALLAVAPAVLAGVMADPTEPPPAFRNAAAEAEGGALPQRVLQSVVLPAKGRGVAIIDGQQVMVGGKFGESRLTALSEREAVLEGPSGIERLQLTPEAVKVNVPPRPAAPQREPAKDRARS